MGGCLVCLVTKQKSRKVDPPFWKKFKTTQDAQDADAHAAAIQKANDARLEEFEE